MATKGLPGGEHAQRDTRDKGRSHILGRMERHFLVLLRMACDLKPMGCLLLEFSTEYFPTVVDHGELKPGKGKPWNGGAGVGRLLIQGVAAITNATCEGPGPMTHS